VAAILTPLVVAADNDDWCRENDSTLLHCDRHVQIAIRSSRCLVGLVAAETMMMR